MNRLKYILLSAAAAILILFLTIKIYFHYDIPLYAGSQSIVGLKDTVEVFTDNFGVPQVFAKTEEDLFFTAGYLTARERLFQLSLTAAIIGGDLSELLGDEYLEHDHYLKNFSQTKNIPNHINEDIKQIIESYCAGINYWIDEVGNNLPPEFKILNTTPIKWKTSDVLDVYSLYTDGIFIDWKKSYLSTLIQKYYSESKLDELFLPNDLSNTILDNQIFPDSVYSAVKCECDIKQMISAVSVGAEHTFISVSDENDSNKPTLTIIDISGPTQPAKWFEMRLKGGRFDIEGAFLPGFPLPLIGRNNVAAWGITPQDFHGLDYINSINNLFNIVASEEIPTTISITNKNIVYMDSKGTIYGQIEEFPKDNLSIKLFENSDRNVQNAISQLREFAYNSKLPEQFVFNVLKANLLKNIFKDEFDLIGPEVFQCFIELPKLTEQSLLSVFKNNESSWINNINTKDNRESFSEIVNISVNQTIQDLVKYKDYNFTYDLKTQVLFKHLLGDKYLLNKLFKFNVSASHNNPYAYDIDIRKYLNDGSIEPISGTSLQRIFNLDDFSKSYSVSPTGQSGLPKSDNYSDQTELYSNDKYRTIDFDESVVRSSVNYRKLVLTPKQ